MIHLDDKTFSIAETIANSMNISVEELITKLVIEHARKVLKLE